MVGYPTTFESEKRLCNLLSVTEFYVKYRSLVNTCTNGKIILIEINDKLIVNFSKVNY